MRLISWTVRSMSHHGSRPMPISRPPDSRCMSAIASFQIWTIAIRSSWSLIRKKFWPPKPTTFGNTICALIPSWSIIAIRGAT